MTKGISINIGLNELDENHYTAHYPRLFSCVRDAQNMADIADGFEIILLDEPSKTKVKYVKEKIRYASGKLIAGDILLVTFSGHGSQIRDTDGDEISGLDQTWCLYDRQIIDDELAELWSEFKPGVRIFFISDSCHSGTVAMNFMTAAKDAEKLVFKTNESETDFPDESDSRAGRVRTRTLQGWLKNKIIEDNYESIYEPVIKNLTERLAEKGVEKFNDLILANFISISACQDNQEAKDGDDNGVFTAALKKIWNNGIFPGNYKDFYEGIFKETEDTVNPTQNPKYLPINEESFQKMRPFHI